METMLTYQFRGRAPAPAVLMSAAPAESPQLTREEQPLAAVNVPWNVVVWDDPVNLMSYVVYVFRSHFGFTDAKARTLMLEVLSLIHI